MVLFCDVITELDNFTWMFCDGASESRRKRFDTVQTLSLPKWIADKESHAPTANNTGVRFRGVGFCIDLSVGTPRTPCPKNPCGNSMKRSGRGAGVWFGYVWSVARKFVVLQAFRFFVALPVCRLSVSPYLADLYRWPSSSSRSIAFFSQKRTTKDVLCVVHAFLLDFGVSP